MEIEQLLEVLNALIPEQVAQWRYTRDLAQPDLKARCEKDIYATAYRLLGDFRKHPFLSLPPKDKRKRSFHLGTLRFGNKQYGSFGISKDELLKGMVVFGTHGSGKTNVVLQLVKQLIEKDIPFVFFDWKRNARELIPHVKKPLQVFTPGKSLSPLAFNPFQAPQDFEHHQYVDLLIDVMSKAFQLGEGARRVLQTTLTQAYSEQTADPTLPDILSQLNTLSLSARSQGWKDTAQRALESLLYSKIVPENNSADTTMIQSLTKQFTVIEFDGLATPIKRFLIPILTLWLYYSFLSTKKREQLQLVIIIEEAHNILPNRAKGVGESFLESVIKQSRELGIGFVIVDQHPAELSSSVGNMYTTVSLQLNQPEDTRRAAELLLLHNNQRHWLQRLGVGEGIVKLNGRWQHPIHLSFPYLPLEKGLMSDEKVQQYIKDSLTVSGLRSFLNKEFSGKRGFPPSDRSELSPDERNFLTDIVSNPTAGVYERYSRLRFGTSKGNRIQSKLTKIGYLTQKKIRVGNTHRLILDLTSEARQIMETDTENKVISIFHESDEHRYWKQYYRELFTQNGYSVEEEAHRKGSEGKVDLLARKVSESVAIEIETGKSDILKNLLLNLEARFDRILIVATSKKALKKVEGVLNQKGLLENQRVEVMLQNQVVRLSRD